MLVTMTARLVRSHGKDEIPLPGSGRIEYRPESHGTYQGALRGMDAVVSKIAEGVAEPVELTPGPWRVTVVPDHGPAWGSWLIELTEGMPEPVDLVDLAPVVVIDGEKWARGAPGASVVGGRDNGDGTVSFELEDGTFTDPVVLPPGPAGRGIASISDPDAESRVTVTYTDGDTQQVQAIRGADGHSPVITWDGTTIVTDGTPGPDLKGEPGKPGDPGPASTVPGPPGPPGRVLTPESMLVVGPGRPDAPTTTGMTSAALAALPVGCEYRSVDGAGVGAWTWTKRPAGWVVTDGDTGWHKIAAAGGFSETSYVRLSRKADEVSMQFTTWGITSAHVNNWTTILTVPAGYRAYKAPEVQDIYLNYAGVRNGGAPTAMDAHLRLRVAGAGSVGATEIQLWCYTSSPAVGGFSWRSGDSWPATLPS